MEFWKRLPFFQLSGGWNWLVGRLIRWKLGCKRRILGCLLVFILLLILLCSLFFFATKYVDAASNPLSIFLLIDHSESMWLNSDPALLRHDAVRLFVSFLGVDDEDLVHQTGVIFFGEEARLVTPLVPLENEENRSEILASLLDPPRMGWTDPARALRLARTELDDGAATGSPVIILVTDGKPAWAEAPTEAEQAAYLAALEDEREQLVAAGVSVFVILLTDAEAEPDPEVTELWEPVWRQLTAETGGGFYPAGDPVELADIYHDIVLVLTDNVTAGPVVEAEVGAGGLREWVEVEANLTRLMLVISKGNPDISVTILLPDGTPLTSEINDVRYAGSLLEEVWVVDEPMPGQWTILITGEGQVTVWKDYRSLPATPTPTPTTTSTPLPTATRTPIPTHTSTPRPTATASPTATPPATLRLLDFPESAMFGLPLTVTAQLQNPPDRPFELWLLYEPPSGNEQTVHLLDDGRLGDTQPGDGRYSGLFTPSEPGENLAVVQLSDAGEILAEAEARFKVEAAPHLVFIGLEEAVYRPDDALEISAEWQMNGRPVAQPERFVFKTGTAVVSGPGGATSEVTLLAGPDGRLVGKYRPPEPGHYTVTVSAEVELPAGQSLQAEAAPWLLAVQRRPARWPWLLGLVGFVGLLAWGGYQWRHKRGPIVQGELHHLSGPGFASGEPFVELDTLSRSLVTVGGAPADIPLIGAAGQFAIQPGFGLSSAEGQPLDSGWEMQISGPPELLVDGRPLNGEQALCDAAVITFGETRLRYENLRLRGALNLYNPKTR